MNIVLLGPPGSGKGTQGDILSAATGTPRVSTGELLREAMDKRTPLGRKAQEYYDKGMLVPDKIILELIEGVLRSSVADNGVIMDGFPRTVAQAEAVDGVLRERGSEISAALSFEAPAEVLTQRLLGRAAEEDRSDDNIDSIRRRLQVFEEQTKSLISYYEEEGLLRRIDAVGSIEEVSQRVEQALNS